MNKFDPRTEKVVQHYWHDPNDPTSLGSDIAVHVFEDSAGTFWVGTYGGGLNKLNPDGTFERYTEENGFPTNNITNILEDNEGNLWLGSKIGYIRFNPQTKAAKVYTVEDGLAGNEFQEASLCKARDGTLWLATITGANSFDPSEMRDNPIKPPVYLTALKQGGEELEIGSAPEKVREITLDWQHNFFEFEYAALNYTKPEKNQYQYMLEGYDQDWYNAGTRRFGRYSGLPGGTYTLRVRGSNNDGIWSDQEAMLRVTVIPPWWETWVFRIGLGVVIVGLVMGGMAWRVRAVENQRRTLARLVEQRTADLQQANEQLQVAKEEAEAQRAGAETARQEAEAARQEAELQREKAEIASQAKSEFLSSMSHELRTPLNGILGYAQILKRNKELTTLQRNGLNIIQQSGEHLLTLINDILDLSKIEARKFELFPVDVNLPDFLEGVAGIIRIRMQNKGIGFALDLAPELPTSVYADEKRLRQVLINLLTNAVKFTDNGSVTLQVKEMITPRTTENVKVLRFTISDTGVGIAPDQLEKIFEPFEQTEAGKKQAEGTGLGLAISRRIVRAMESELKVESEVGRGSTFWFDVALPLAEVRTQEFMAITQEITGYTGPRLSVLVADDKEHNRAILRNIFVPLGFEFIEAEDGEAALLLAQKTQPDLIMMDMVMPGLTGFEATRQIREIPALKNTIIFGCSASVFDEDKRKMKLSGCDAFLPKPVEIKQLMQLLQEYLHVEWHYEDTGSATEAPFKPQAEFVPPPQANLAEGYELAQAGNMRQIRAWAEAIGTQDAQYLPFAEKVQELARAFQKRQIVALIEQYLEA
ncbi:MAG: response regulator [Anaerolineae bacterium]|nr:response regulator [Anaerolineae bacterium]